MFFNKNYKGKFELSENRNDLNQNIQNNIVNADLNINPGIVVINDENNVDNIINNNQNYNNATELKNSIEVLDQLLIENQWNDIHNTNENYINIERNNEIFIEIKNILNIIKKELLLIKKLNKAIDVELELESEINDIYTNKAVNLFNNDYLFKFFMVFSSSFFGLFYIYIIKNLHKWLDQEPVEIGRDMDLHSVYMYPVLPSWYFFITSKIFKIIIVTFQSVISSIFLKLSTSLKWKKYLALDYNSNIVENIENIENNEIISDNIILFNSSIERSTDNIVLQLESLLSILQENEDILRNNSDEFYINLLNMIVNEVNSINIDSINDVEYLNVHVDNFDEIINEIIKILDL